MAFLFFFYSMHNKTTIIIRLHFCDSQNNQGLSMGKGWLKTSSDNYLLTAFIRMDLTDNIFKKSRKKRVLYKLR